MPVRFVPAIVCPDPTSVNAHDFASGASTDVCGLLSGFLKNAKKREQKVLVPGGGIELPRAEAMRY
jgi:hypothetical protein